jgi:hypothetical protein
MATGSPADRFGDEEATFVLEHAYVPEHVVPLMTTLSGGRPFLLDDWLGLVGDGGVILIGYPLASEFTPASLQAMLAEARGRFDPTRLRVIAPEVADAEDRDEYIALDLSAETDPKLGRVADRAREGLTVERGAAWTEDHAGLVRVLEERASLPPMVAALYDAMPDYVARTETGHLLDARDPDGRLAAFFVVETAARTFDAWLLGAHSKEAYASHASDLLFAEMIGDARARGKRTLELGLAVNDGIRRFKTKWGGRAERPYAYREDRFRTSLIGRMLRSFLR